MSVSVQNLTPIQPLQLAQITIGGFTITGVPQPADVMPPLVSTDIQMQSGTKYLNVKMVVFMPKPILGQPPLSLYLDTSMPSNQLSLVLRYTSAETAPTNYQTWYVCYKHVINPTSEPIDTVETTLENIVQTGENPRTKRGTVTQVLQS